MRVSVWDELVASSKVSCIPPHRCPANKDAQEYHEHKTQTLTQIMTYALAFRCALLGMTVPTPSYGRPVSLLTRCGVSPAVAYLGERDTKHEGRRRNNSLIRC